MSATDAASPNPVAMTPSAVGLVREHALTFDAAGYRIPAALTVPTAVASGDTVPSAILLIPGSLFADVHGDFPAWNVFPHVYGHLARQLSARGHVVFRFAKLGPGTGSVAIDEAIASRHRTWATRLLIARAAHQAMRDALAGECLTTSRTIFAGHSEGSVVASQLALAAADTFDAVVLLAGPSVGILGIMCEQSPTFAPPGLAGEYSTDIRAAVDLIRAGLPIPAQLAARPAARALGAMDAIGLAYMRDCDATDPALLAGAIVQPMLIVQGGRDGSVPTHHGERLRDVRGSHATAYRHFPELQHMFKVLPDGLTAMEAFGLTGEADPRVTTAMDDWVRALPPRA